MSVNTNAITSEDPGISNVQTTIINELSDDPFPRRVDLSEWSSFVVFLLAIIGLIFAVVGKRKHVGTPREKKYRMLFLICILIATMAVAVFSITALIARNHQQMGF